MLETDVLDCSPATLATDWPEPTDLPKPKTPDNEFPIDALGHILGNAVRAAQNANQAPLALNAQSFLAAANYSVQAHANILSGSETKPISEFFLTIGQSGERKTSCDRAALMPLYRYSKELDDRYRIEKQIHKRKHAAWKATHDRILRQGKNTKSQNEKELLELGDEPEPPLFPILKCAEPTMEGLYGSFLKGQPSQALFSDEGGQFLGGSSMSEDNKTRAIGILCNYWDGQKQERIRVGDELTSLWDRRLAMHLMVQPAVIVDTLNSPKNKEQGLLGRFLVAYPNSTIGYRPYRRVKLSKDQAYMVYCAQMESHLNAPLPLRPGSRNELTPRLLELDDKAQAGYESLYNIIEREQQPKGRYSDMKEFASKAAEHCLRLAATLALFENLHASSISAEHVERASVLVEFYLAEWLRLSGGLKPDGDEAMAGKLLDWLETKKLDIVTVTDIAGGGPSCFRVSGAAKQAIDCLTEYGWLKPAPPNIEVRGRKRREAFFVHPKLFARHA